MATADKLSPISSVTY